MLMIATVQEVRQRNLLVRDRTTGQEVIVNTNYARCFSVGDRISIFYNGAMTASIPPQISAIRIRRIIPGCSCR